MTTNFFKLLCTLFLLGLAACSQPVSEPAPVSETVELSNFANGTTDTTTGIFSGQKGNILVIPYQVPLGADNLKVSISGGSGDADLYVHYGEREPASLNNYNQVVGHVNGNSESYDEEEPLAGQYFIALSGVQTYRNVTLEASFEINKNTSDFNITLAFDPSLKNAYIKDIVKQVARQWEQVITSDITDVASFTKPANACTDKIDPALNNVNIDDILLFVIVKPLDGRNGFIAQGATCFVRTASGLPVAATLSIDSADIGTSRNPKAPILHEIGHALGIGTLWADKKLVNFTPAQVVSGQCGTNPVYTGANGVREWKLLRKTLTGNLATQNTIPVEERGVGAACGHWDEEVFDSELMTGFVENGGTEPLSRLSIASLEDLGYTVSYRTAQPYALPKCAPRCSFVATGFGVQNFRSLEPHGHSEHVHAPLLQPTGSVDAQGNIHLLF